MLLMSHAPLHFFMHQMSVFDRDQYSTEERTKLLLASSFCRYLTWASCAIIRLKEAVIERWSIVSADLLCNPIHFPEGVRQRPRPICVWMCFRTHAISTHFLDGKLLSYLAMPNIASQVLLSSRTCLLH